MKSVNFYGRRLLVWAVLALTVTAMPALAQTSYLWADDVSGNWSTAGMWSPSAGWPGMNTSDSASITATGSPYQVTLDTDVTIANFTLNSANATFYAPSATLTVTGNSVFSAGKIDLAGGRYVQNGGTFQFAAGAVTGSPIELNNAVLDQPYTGLPPLQSPASFVMRGNCTMKDSTHGANAGGSIYSGQQVTVLAAGQAATLSKLEANYGTLNLDSTSAHDVTLGQNSPNWICNSGTVNIQPGAGGARTIISNDFRNYNPGVVNINAPTRFATAHGSMRTWGPSFNIAPTASLDLDAGGQLFQMGIPGSTFGNVNVQGHLRVTSGTFELDGGTLTGTPELINSTLDLRITNAASFLMHKDCTIQNNTAAGTINAGQSVSVVAAGQAASLSGLAVNAGALSLSSSSAHGVTLNSSGTLTNQGTISVLAGAGGSRNITCDFLNAANATVDLDAATSFSKAAGSVVNAGHWDMRGARTVSVTGSFEQDSTGDLLIQLAGLNSSQYDQLNVSGAALFDGSLVVSLDGGFAPAKGNSFDILNFSSTGGTHFASLSLPSLGSGLAWDTSALYTTGVLSVVPDPATAMLMAVTLALGAARRVRRRR